MASNNNNQDSSKGRFECVVRYNRHIRDVFYRIGLEFFGDGARAFAATRAGQFAQLDLSSAALPEADTIPKDLADAAQRKILLRRPFSFTDVTVSGDKTRAEILYCVVGPGSLRMTSLSPGDTISVIGPLGNGFWMPEGKRTALLVGGGMGIGPLEHLAKVLKAEHCEIEVLVFAGAKSADKLPFEVRSDEISQEPGMWLAEFAEHGVESLVATDDGSAGWHGSVIDCLSQWLGKSDSAGADTIIYACGPEAMLARMAEVAAESDVDCQVSMERRMACGIGLCQSCAIECRTEVEGETVYKMCCKDGPVFDSRDVVFNLG